MHKILTALGLAAVAVMMIAAFPRIQVDNGRILVTDGKIQFAAAVIKTNAVWYDGSSGRGTGSNPNIFHDNISQSWTLNFWVNTANTDYYQPMISKGTSVGPARWKIDHRDATHVWLFYNDGSPKEIYHGMTATINDGTWHMITLAHQPGAADTNWFWYFDGTFKTLEAGLNQSPVDSAITNYPFNFGFGVESSTYWGGTIDEFGFWNRTLNSNEVATLWNSGVGVYGNVANAPFNDSFASGYHFDEGTGTNFASFGENTAGTLTGTIAWSNGIPVGN